MIWLAWRQFRVQAITAAVALFVFALALAYTGPHLLHLYHASGITACEKAHGDCGPLVDAFSSHYPILHGLGALLIVLPGVVGVFWGAPLVARELETGTHRVAWTQSVTRTRWLATKVAMLGAASVVTVAAFELGIAWWSSPLDKVSGNRFGTAMFAQRGVAPVAYAAFAFALGVLAGTIIRRTLAAMAATFGGFAAVRFVMQQFVRPRLATPFHVSAGVFGRDTATRPGDWIVSSRTVTASGQSIEIRHGVLRNMCGIPEGDFSRGALQSCAQRLGVHQILTVQPAHRYWPFQIAEASIFTVLALLVVGAAFWWTRRKVT
jgi:hypothetical protein